MQRNQGISGQEVRTYATALIRPEASIEPLFNRTTPYWKRGMDILGAIVGIIIFGPAMLAVAAAVKFTSKGPIIFKQKRAGRGGKSFDFYKFRSMYVGAEEKLAELMKMQQSEYASGPAFKMKDDPRITPVGKFIRRWSLDELPQFLTSLWVT